MRWREGNGRVRTRSLPSKREALAFDADVKARKFKGQALPRPGRETLASAYNEWWRLRGSTLATTTQRTYKAVWKAHVQDRFDHHTLNQLAADPQLFEELMAEMRERKVGNAAQRKVLVVLSAVLTAAVEWQKIATNPVWRMRKPPGTRQRHPHPFPPVVVERIRVRMRRRRTMNPLAFRSWHDACLVTVMSYAGLRPGEALALTWGDIGEHTIAVDKAVSDGKQASTKTGAARAVPLVRPLKEDLNDLFAFSGDPREGDLLFPSARGGCWSMTEFRNWRQRVWKPIVKDLADGDPGLARLAAARPYDCRGSFVSLQLRAGASPLEVAQWAGHSPAVMFRHYANIIEELVGEPKLSAEEQIERARQAVSERPKRELDQLTVDLFRRPTLARAGNKESAASIFFRPQG